MHQKLGGFKNLWQNPNRQSVIGQAQASKFLEKLPRVLLTPSEQTHCHCLQINYFVGEFQEGFGLSSIVFVDALKGHE